MSVAALLLSSKDWVQTLLDSYHVGRRAVESWGGRRPRCVAEEAYQAPRRSVKKKRRNTEAAAW
jgi:hypothetical protein